MFYTAVRQRRALQSALPPLRLPPGDSRTANPLAVLFTGHVASKFLYLETCWGSLISFGLTAALLKDILPVTGTTNPETVHQHLHRVANRHEADLGGEPTGSGDDAPTAGQLPVAQGAVVVGIDGGLASTYLV